MQGTVRFWSAESGWGVIDSAGTPGGCWAHFSVVVMDGLRELQEGQVVTFDAERANQDGYAFRALSVRPEPTGRGIPGSPVGGGSAYGSTFSITDEVTPNANGDPNLSGDE